MLFSSTISLIVLAIYASSSAALPSASPSTDKRSGDIFVPTNDFDRSGHLKRRDNTGDDAPIDWNALGASGAQMA